MIATTTALPVASAAPAAPQGLPTVSSVATEFLMSANELKAQAMRLRQQAHILDQEAHAFDRCAALLTAKFCAPNCK